MGSGCSGDVDLYGRVASVTNMDADKAYAVSVKKKYLLYAVLFLILAPLVGSNLHLWNELGVFFYKRATTSEQMKLIYYAINAAIYGSSIVPLFFGYKFMRYGHLIRKLANRPWWHMGSLKDYTW